MKTMYRMLQASLPVVFSLLMLPSHAQTSDTRDAKPLENALADIMQLEPVVFSVEKNDLSKTDIAFNDRPYGLVTGNLEKLIPGVVNTTYKLVPAGKNAYRNTPVKTINYEALIPHLIASVREQQVEIEKLKAQVAALQKGK